VLDPDGSGRVAHPFTGHRLNAQAGCVEPGRP
jgi:hypothetical protein